MKGPDEAGEHFNGPRVAENVLHVGNVHTELVAESLFDVEGDFAEEAMDLRNALVGHSDLGKIGILEETVVGLFFLDTEGHSAVVIGLISAGLWKRNLALVQKCDVASIFVLDSALNVLGASHVFDLDAGGLVLLALHRKVDINTKLTVFDLSLRDAKSLQKFLQLTNNEFRVVRVSWVRSGDNLEERHAGPIVVDQDLVAFVNRLGCVLLHLDALY